MDLPVELCFVRVLVARKALYDITHEIPLCACKNRLRETWAGFRTHSKAF